MVLRVRSSGLLVCEVGERCCGTRSLRGPAGKAAPHSLGQREADQDWRDDQGQGYPAGERCGVCKYEAYCEET